MDITSANAEILMNVPALSIEGLKIQKFSTDSIADISEIELTEYRIGVDGQMAMGVVISPKEITLNIEADSPSMSQLQLIYTQQEVTRVVYPIVMMVKIPSIKRTIVFTDGGISNAKFPSLAKVLTPGSVKLVFSRMTIIPIVV